MLRVLTYHRVAEFQERPYLDPSLISATPAAFRRQMQHLRDAYDVVSMEQVLDTIENHHSLSSRAVLITFDDGYRDFAENAWPVLRELGLASVLFVPTAFPGEANDTFWWDRLYFAMMFTPNRALRDSLLGTSPADPYDKLFSRLNEIKEMLKALPHAEAMAYISEITARLEAAPPKGPHVLTWPELRWLSQNGVAIGAHTRTHPILTGITPDQQRDEIRGAQEDLRRELETVLPIFSYPSGQHEEATVRLLAEGDFKVAFTTLDGQNDLLTQDPLRLRRTNITPRTTLPVFRMRLWNWFSHVDALRHRRVNGQAHQPTPNGPALHAPGAKKIQEARPAKPQSKHSPRALRIAYVMSRFPKLTETFVLFEMLEVMGLGAQIEIYPLLHERESVRHPAAEELSRDAHFHPFLSWPILQAQAHFLRRRPAAYIRVLLEVLRGTFGSARFFAGAVLYFPKAVRFAYEMSQRGIQHVHAHFANHPALVALIIHRLTGIPFSFTAHGSDLQVDRHMLDHKVEAAEHVITISEYNKELIVKSCGGRFREKVHVVHCGVDPRVFTPRGSGDPRELQIICVGSFEPVKGHRYLIEACRLLKQRGIGFVCHLVGDGYLKDKLVEQIDRSDLCERFYLHGAMSRPEVASLLARADVMALASAPTPDGRREGIPVALMEGMAGGLPVVSTHIGGIPELVETGRSGFLVPPGNAIALADALQKLATDPKLRQRMGKAGRERVLNDFDLRKNAVALLRFFGSEAESAPSEDFQIPPDRPSTLDSFVRQ